MNIIPLWHRLRSPAPDPLSLLAIFQTAWNMIETGDLLRNIERMENGGLVYGLTD